ncbi:MAG TPA: hypothetical protein VLI91_14330, partial [Roseiarcus sp.]|nr:hypothetical protein [Roseiarcus sp.]
IQLGASGNFVYLLNGDTVSKRDVTIGATDGKHTVIMSGLSAGDKVVIDGVDRLRDGAKVKVVDPASAGGGQAGAGPESGAESSAQGAGQHRHRRNDQSGAAETPAPSNGQANPAPATASPAQGEPSPPAPAPAGPAPRSAAPSGARTEGAPAHGSAK